MVSDDEQIGKSEKIDGMELEIDDLEYFVTDRRWHAKERYKKPIIEARVPDHHLKYILVSRQVAVDRRKVRKAENIIAESIDRGNTENGIHEATQRHHAS